MVRVLFVGLSISPVILNAASKLVSFLDSAGVMGTTSSPLV